MRPATVHDVLMRDAIRRPERLVQMLDACEADIPRRAGCREHWRTFTARGGCDDRASRAKA